VPSGAGRWATEISDVSRPGAGQRQRLPPGRRGRQPARCTRGRPSSANQTATSPPTTTGRPPFSTTTTCMTVAAELVLQCSRPWTDSSGTSGRAATQPNLWSRPTPGNRSLGGRFRRSGRTTPCHSEFPSRRSRVRGPSSAFEEAPLMRGFLLDGDVIALAEMAKVQTKCKQAVR
jgi:hypothetical protein